MTKYPIEPNGPKRLEILWDSSRKNTTITFDDSLVDVISSKQELKDGQSFKLRDGSKLTVQLVGSSFFDLWELRVLRNGRPVPGSPSDPLRRIKEAYRVVLALAGFDIVLGLLAVLLKSTLLQGLGLGRPAIVCGAILLVLGVVIRELRSKTAVSLAVVVVAIDIVLGYVLVARSGPVDQSGAELLFARFLLIIPILQGHWAIDQLADEPDKQI